MQHDDPRDPALPPVGDPSPRGVGRGSSGALGVERISGTRRAVLAGAAVALGVLALAGIGIGIAVALHPDDPGSSLGVPSDAVEDAPGREPVPVPSDPEEIVRAIDAAVLAADGEGATSVELIDGAWTVDVRLADGTEVEAVVGPEGRAPLVQPDDDDEDVPTDALLDPDRIEAMISAAVASAGGGTAVAIETTDDDTHRFAVVVDLGDDELVDVHLAADLSAVVADD